MGVRGYKVFDPDWTCRNKQYTCPGEFRQDGELKICENGIHFCKKLINCFNFYPFVPYFKFAEVEAIGDVVEDDEGKSCTNHIRILKELSWHDVLDLVNFGIRNTGKNNTGDDNTGNGNVGNKNSGNCNTGLWDAGDRNTGDNNIGCYNTGSRNIGNWNVGNRNGGNWNVGDWNAGDWNVGCFNTRESTIKMFNRNSDWTISDWISSTAREIMATAPYPVRWKKAADMSEEEKEAHPEYKTTGGYLRWRQDDEMQAWWNGLTKNKKEEVMKLPNFDTEIFKKCTGIDVEQMN